MICIAEKVLELIQCHTIVLRIVFERPYSRSLVQKKITNWAAIQRDASDDLRARPMYIADWSI
jgi:hypothetical protein